MAKPRRRKIRNRPTQGKPAEPRQAGLAPDWWIVGPALVGMLITGYLTGVSGSGGDVAFCAAGSGCDIVQQSRWSTVLGLPVALWGFALYTLIALAAGLMKPQLRRWKRLWMLTLVGLAISLYLTIVGMVVLDAVCLWCLASLATISTIFVVIAVRRPESAPGMSWSRWGLHSGLLALAVIAALHIYYSGLFQPAEDPRLRALAIHLQETDARYYGAFWCPNCQAQHELFGASSERLPYVECTPDGRNGMVSFSCVSKDINGYPTWIINGKRYQGLLRPAELARYSGFDWNKDYSD